jgi:photosystem II stability/assembly factor-like uncharacterized protein
MEKATKFFCFFNIKETNRMKARIVPTLCVLLIFSALTGGQALKSGDSTPTQSFSAALFKGLNYRCIGPSRGGRVTAVTGIPSRPGTFFMGATGGGVWKTEDYGASWENISDGYFATASIGAIAVAASNPDILYVGTGSDGIRSNVISGLGVYRSTDGGRSWTFLGLRDVGQIGAVLIHPGDPERVFIAALGHAFGPNPQRGVYRTLDGGNSWEKVLFVSDNTGAVDLEFAPDDPGLIYASMWQARREPWTIISGGMEGGFFKSSDGGETWKQITEGLPLGLRGKSDIAVSRADPARVYVLMEAPDPHGGLYRSDDRGQSFQIISTYAPLLDRPFYYCNLDADPSDADVLYANSQGFFKSADGGLSWRRLSTPHGDNHDMWIHPRDPDLFIQSNDGGANVTRDGGKTWSTQFNQPTAEIYQVAVDDQFPYWVYGGQQDNSTIMVPSLPPYPSSAGELSYWQAVGGCETGPAVPKPGDHNIVYSNCKGRFGRYSKLTGQEKQYYVGAANMYGHNPKDLKYRFQRVSPIHVSPHDPGIVYHASQYVHKTMDEGITWETISPDLTANPLHGQVYSGSPITRDITGEEFYSTIYALQESPLEKGLIWVGANDGPVHVTRDGGKSWLNVTPPDLPPGGRVQTVEPSPHNPAKAYFAAYRFLLDDWAPYIYRTDDYGRTWKRLTTGRNGLPADFPTRVIREDPEREGLLYAGTEFGMYISFDDGESWQSFQLNLPVTPVTDIKVYRKDLVLSTMGRSFWILDNLTPLHQVSENTTAKGLFLFSPREAVRLRYRGSYRRGASVPEYVTPAVDIDYFADSNRKDPLTLTIKDGSGRIIRTFPDSLLPRDRKDGGVFRLRWDMRRTLTQENEAQGRSFRSRGPLVAPGRYQATLQSGDWSQSVSFSIRMDPRIAAEGVTREDLVAQESLCLRVMDLMGRARSIAARIEKEMEKTDASGSLKDRLSALRSRLVTAGGAYPTPKIIDQISYLYSMLDRADQKPGRDAYVRLDELDEALGLCQKDLEAVLRSLK